MIHSRQKLPFQYSPHTGLLEWKRWYGEMICWTTWMFFIRFRQALLKLRDEDCGRDSRPEQTWIRHWF